MINKEKDAIKRLEICKEYAGLTNGCVIVNEKDLETVLGIIGKQDKMIDEMAEVINQYQICHYEIIDEFMLCKKISKNKKHDCHKCIKEYYEREHNET